MAAEDDYPDFRNVARQGTTPAGPDAARQLQKVCERLDGEGARAAAARLRRIDASAAELAYPTLERLAAPERAADELGGAQQLRAHQLASRRNLLALVPLLITWVFLAWASIDYQRLLARDGSKVEQPFLLLWERRFGGQLIPTFSMVALVDFVVLGYVLLLTVRSHQAEAGIEETQLSIIEELDAAMAALAVAIEQRTVRAPASAEEWVVAAERIIDGAMRQTTKLADACREVLERTETSLDKLLVSSQEGVKLALASSAQAVEQAMSRSAQAVEGALAGSARVVEQAMDRSTEALDRARTEAEQFVTQLFRGMQAEGESAREQYKQFIIATTDEAIRGLRQLSTDNHDMIAGQLGPLLDKFQTTLDEFRRDHELYQRSAAELVNAVTGISDAAGVLAGSAGSYERIATSIDGHLTVIEQSQGDFISRVAQSAESMRLAAGSIGAVSQVLQKDLRDDLKAMTRNVVAASERLAVVDGDLARTSTNLRSASASLGTVATALDAAAATLGGSIPTGRTRPWWRRRGH